MNPPDKIARLAAEVALILKARALHRPEFVRLLRDFNIRVDALYVLDDATLEQIAEGKVPESPPSPMPRGSEMMLERRR